jgi:hypothetical protein
MPTDLASYDISKHVLPTALVAALEHAVRTRREATHPSPTLLKFRLGMRSQPGKETHTTHLMLRARAISRQGMC